MTADLLAEVRARHADVHKCVGRAGGWYNNTWPCDAVKLTALLTPERLATALPVASTEAWLALGSPEPGEPRAEWWQAFAAAIVAALTSELKP